MKYIVRYGEREHVVEVLPEDGAWNIVVDGRAARVDSAELAPGAYSILADGRSREVAVEREGDQFRVRLGGDTLELTVLDEVRARTRRPERAAVARGPVSLKAPMPGLVVELKIAPGQAVKQGQPVIVIEAMKMQNELVAPADGTVEKIHVDARQSVEANQPLITFAPAAPAASE